VREKAIKLGKPWLMPAWPIWEIKMSDFAPHLHREGVKSRRGDLMQKRAALYHVHLSWIQLEAEENICSVSLLFASNILPVPGLMHFLGFLHTEFKYRIITMINKVRLYVTPAWNIQTWLKSCPPYCYSQSP